MTYFTNQDVESSPGVTGKCASRDKPSPNPPKGRGQCKRVYDWRSIVFVRILSIDGNDQHNNKHRHADDPSAIDCRFIKPSRHCVPPDNIATAFAPQQSDTDASVQRFLLVQ